jgi:hypothetical protein
MMQEDPNAADEALAAAEKAEDETELTAHDGGLVVAAEKAEDETEPTAHDSGIAMKVPTVTWFRQLGCTLTKNYFLITRRPFTIFLMMFSSVLSVLLAWSSGRDNPDWNFDEIPLAACGNVEDSFLRSLWTVDGVSSNDIPMSHNENWRDGVAVTLMGTYRKMRVVLCHASGVACCTSLPVSNSTI